MSHLQCFVEEVVADHVGVDVSTFRSAISSNANTSGNILVWVELVTVVMDIVMEVIESCQERNQKRLVDELRNPNFFNRVRFRGKLRRELGWKTWLQHGDSLTEKVFARATLIPDDEAFNLVNEVRSNEWK